MNTLTVDEVKAIHAAEAARKDVPGDWDPRKSGRVMVHAALQARNPVPYGPHVLPAEMQAQKAKAFAEGVGVPRVDHAAHVAHMRAQVTEDDHAAYARAKGTLDAVGVLDAHHFAQKMHGKALWAETDRALAEAVPS